MLSIEGRSIPLTQSEFVHAHELREATSQGSVSLFPEARDPNAAYAGLLLFLGGWEEAHHAAQDVENREGNYWHGILHRIEPDSANANYWFRRVGQHPLFAALHAAATRILEESTATGWRLHATWEPARYIDWCEEARRQPGSPKHNAAAAIQQAECRLLFDYCRETETRS